MNWTQLLFILVAGTLSLGRAQEAEKHPVQDLKYLIVVDSSYSMLTRRHATMGSVEGLVKSGFQNQIQPGDKFAVWTFNDQIDSGSFTPRVWDPKKAQELADEATLFAGQNGNKARASFDLLLSELGHLPPLTTNVLVVLFTDGAERLYGTPFDAVVNTAFEKDALTLRASARPFVVAFCIQDGRFTQGMVYSGHGPLRLPVLPGRQSEPPPPAPQVAAKETPKAAVPEPAPVRPAAASVERMKQTVPTPRPTVFNFPPGSNLPADDPAPIPFAARPARAVRKSPTPLVTAPAAKPVATAHSTPKPERIVASTTPSSQPAQPAVSKPAATPAAVKNAPASTAVVAAAVVSSPAKPSVPASMPQAKGPEAASPKTSSPAPEPQPLVPAAPEAFAAATPINHFTLPQLMWFGVGAASVALCFSGVYFLRGNRRKPGPSLISQSLAGKP